MRRVLTRLGIEATLLVGGCVIGAWVWMHVASYYNEAADTYWTANGHPPPFGEYAAPPHLMPVLILAPYAAAVAIRLLLRVTKVARLEGAGA